MPVVPDGEISNLYFSADGREIAFELSAPDMPLGLYSVRPGTSKLTRWFSAHLYQ